MFNENKKEEKVKGKVETIMGKGTKIDGDITTSGSLRVEGEVNGHVKAEGDVFVGESGVVKSEIEAREIIIAGKVEADVTALKKLAILPKGKLHGDIRCASLKIEEGGSFIGTSKKMQKGKNKRSTKNAAKKINKKKKDKKNPDKKQKGGTK